MTNRWALLAGVIGIVVLSACSKNGVDAETDGGGVVEETGADSSQSMVRLEDCEVAGEMADRIRDAELHLDELRSVYTDLHPEVMAAIDTLDGLVQSALSDCVEDIQSR